MITTKSQATKHYASLPTSDIITVETLDLMVCQAFGTNIHDIIQEKNIIDRNRILRDT